MEHQAGGIRACARLPAGTIGEDTDMEWTELRKSETCDVYRFSLDASRHIDLIHMKSRSAYPSYSAYIRNDAFPMWDSAHETALGTIGADSAGEAMRQALDMALHRFLAVQQDTLLMLRKIRFASARMDRA